MSTMRAMVFHGPGDLRAEQWPVPEPRRGEVVLKIEAALTCGTDVKTLRRGHPVMIPRVPTVFGHEFAGTVAAVGANSAPCRACALCRAGRANLCEDLLFVNGAYGEFIALPARLVALNLVRLQPGTVASRAAFAEPLACALGGIERARVESGQSVVIFGHGPLGCLLGMVAAARKARVIMVGKRGWRLDQVRRLRIGDCLDATASSDIVHTLREHLDGHGADVAIDATGLPNVWEQALAVVGRGGTVVFFGGCAPGTTVSLDTRRAHYEELTLLGAFHHTPDLIRRAIELLDSGALHPEGLLTHRMGLEAVTTALDLMARGEALKVLIEPGYATPGG